MKIPSWKVLTPLILILVIGAYTYNHYKTKAEAIAFANSFVAISTGGDYARCHEAGEYAGLPVVGPLHEDASTLILYVAIQTSTPVYKILKNYGAAFNFNADFNAAHDIKIGVDGREMSSSCWSARQSWKGKRDADPDNHIRLALWSDFNNKMSERND